MWKVNEILNTSNRRDKYIILNNPNCRGVVHTASSGIK